MAARSSSSLLALQTRSLRGRFLCPVAARAPRRGVFIAESRKYPSSTEKRENEALTASWRANKKNRDKSPSSYSLSRRSSTDTPNACAMHKRGRKGDKKSGPLATEEQQEARETRIFTLFCLRKHLLKLDDMEELDDFHRTITGSLLLCIISDDIRLRCCLK